MKKNILILIFILLVNFPQVLAQRIQPHRISIVTSDIAMSSAWYSTVFGMEVFDKMEFPEYDSLTLYFLKNQDFELELLEKSSAFSINRYVPDYNVNTAPMLGFYKITFVVDDVKSLFDKCKGLNADIVIGITEDKKFNDVYFIIKDLDGNSLQFIQKNITKGKGKGKSAFKN